MRPEFRRANHTFILSDIHLTTAERPHPHRPLWKKYKTKQFFIDESFERFLAHIRELAGGPAELILNGDIFDFDSVTDLPPKPAPESGDKKISISWLERKRGLSAEEPKSRFKMERILEDHSHWVKALRDYVMAGNRLIFIIGNHDMELHWPSVQSAIRDALALPDDKKDLVRFCEWFYISNADTLIEHGNQYDAYTLCSNPIHPLIKIGTKMHVRIPFGNLANKFMLNGMGLFNPHVQSQYIMSFMQYVRFFFKYQLRTQPFLMMTWFWGAMATLIYSIAEGFLPAVKDPLTVESRVAEIAYKANASPRMVRNLKEIHVHPAYYNPFKIMRELWLDRALLFGLVLFMSVEFVAVLKLFADVSIWWITIPILVLMPFFVFYANSVKSELDETTQQAPARSVTLSSRLTRVKRIVHGHTHEEVHTWIDGVELLNTGTWSPGFEDVECTKPFGRKPFAWIKKPAGAEPGQPRVAELREWKDPVSAVIPSKSP